MAGIVTTAQVEFEVNGVVEKILLTRISRKKDKELTLLTNEAAKELIAAQAIDNEIDGRAADALDKTTILAKAAEAAPLGMEKVTLYKDLLVAKLEYRSLAAKEKVSPKLWESYAEKMEEISKTRYAALVADGGAELKKLIDAGYISYSEAVTELQKAFEEAAKKKSATSNDGQENKEQKEKSGEE